MRSYDVDMQHHWCLNSTDPLTLKQKTPETNVQTSKSMDPQRPWKDPDWRI